MRRATIATLFLGVLIAGSAHSAIGQAPQIYTQELQTVATATSVLEQFTSLQMQSIPRQLLREAQGVVIIPSVVKVGFVIAGRFGRGVALVRTPEGAWRAPVFVTFTGGSVGWQIGVQSTDVVLVFKNRRGIESLLTGSKFTLGADAAIAAGPVGRQASTGTDIKLNAEIYSYSRSRGLFAGVALDGSVLQVDNNANLAFYTGGVVPESAVQLAMLLARDTQTAGAVPQTTATSTVPEAALSAAPAGDNASQRAAMRQAIVASGGRLHANLDAQWKSFLALPRELQSGTAPVPAKEAADVLKRYERVQTDPTFRMIADMPDFQTTLALLRTYLSENAQPAASQPAATTAALPTPPK
jgi:lipid-binding SYLF domain-containing protein